MGSADPLVRDWTVPPSVAGPIAEEEQPVLLYVHTGTACIEAGSTAYTVTARDAVWVPPGIRHRTTIAAGGVVLPLFPDARRLPKSLATVRTVTIPLGWESWMVQRHVEDVHVEHDLRDEPSGRDLLLELVTGHPGSDRYWAAPKSLRMPRSREARNVAQRLLRDPGSGLAMESFAARQSISTKTLQRQFQRETGLPFSEWRTRARVVAAARLLAAGREVGWTGQHAGYATAAGFTRAFRRHAGITPSEFRRRARSSATDTASSDRVIERVAALVTANTPGPPLVAARSTWIRVNEEHLLLWVYQGQVDVRIGTRDFQLEAGDAVWLPAGVPNTVECAVDSIAIPLGYSTSHLGLTVDALTVSSFPPEAATFLLHTSVTNFTLFETESGPDRLIDELFRAQYLSGYDADATAGLTGAVGLIASALRTDPANSRSLADWATHLNTSPHDLGQEFLRQTGMTFPRWRAHHRMDMARWFLSLGDTPGDAARQLGYASSAGFANAFTAAHGFSPSRFQQRQSTNGSFRD